MLQHAHNTQTSTLPLLVMQHALEIERTIKSNTYSAKKKFKLAARICLYLIYMEGQGLLL